MDLIRFQLSTGFSNFVRTDTLCRRSGLLAKMDQFGSLATEDGLIICSLPAIGACTANDTIQDMSKFGLASWDGIKLFLVDHSFVPNLDPVDLVRAGFYVQLPYESFVQLFTFFQIKHRISPRQAATIAQICSYHCSFGAYMDWTLICWLSTWIYHLFGVDIYDLSLPLFSGTPLPTVRSFRREFMELYRQSESVLYRSNEAKCERVVCPRCEKKIFLTALARKLRSFEDFCCDARMRYCKSCLRKYPRGPVHDDWTVDNPVVHSCDPSSLSFIKSWDDDGFCDTLPDYNLTDPETITFKNCIWKTFAPPHQTYDLFTFWEPHFFDLTF